MKGGEDQEQVGWMGPTRLTQMLGDSSTSFDRTVEERQWFLVE